MLAEHEPTQTAENALYLEVGDKRILYTQQDWYTNKDIAHIVGRSMSVVGPQLHKIRANPKSIEFTTIGDLRRKGNLALIGIPQTIVYNEENFIKAVIAVASIKTKPLPRKTHSEPNIHKSPTSKEKKPKKPNNNNHSPFNPFVPITESPPKPPMHIKEILHMKDPKQILAANSVIKALSHLANGTLEKDIPNNIKEFLEQVAMEHVQLPRFEYDPNEPEENILIKILDSDLPNRLKRFFKVNLDSMLYDLWDVIDINEGKLKQEKEIIEICNQLMEKGYHKEKVFGELYGHFGIIIQNKIFHPV
jgi:hypothetical protein